jgi:hypothetical protein
MPGLVEGKYMYHSQRANSLSTHEISGMLWVCLPFAHTMVHRLYLLIAYVRPNNGELHVREMNLPRTTSVWNSQVASFSVVTSAGP